MSISATGTCKSAGTSGSTAKVSLTILASCAPEYVTRPKLKSANYVSAAGSLTGHTSTQHVPTIREVVWDRLAMWTALQFDLS